MSISSCPQCARPISLPTGINTTAKVRCPLCRAQYSLADALANVPPVLEVIEDLPIGAGPHLMDLPADQGLEAEPHDGSRFAAVPTDLDLAGLPTPGADAAPVADMSYAESDEEELSFEAPEIEHDDLTMQEQDTEIEELGFTTSEPHHREAPADTDHIELAGPGDETVPFLSEDASARDELARDAADGEEEIEIDFDHVPSTDQPGVADEVKFDFDEPESARQDIDAEMTLDPAAGESKSDEPRDELDFGEAFPAAGPGDQETIDFDFSKASRLGESADQAETALEFGEPIEAEPTPVTAADQPPPAEEKGKKKKKKPREKAPAKAGVQGSLVRTLVSLLLCSVVALPVALYGVLWISPDYDFFEIGRKLPTWAQPPGLAKSKLNRSVATAPIPQPVQPEPQATGPSGAEPTPLVAESSPPPPTEPASQAAPAEPPKADSAGPTLAPSAPAPAVETPEPKSDDAPPEPPKADEPAAIAETSEPAKDADAMPDESADIESDKPGIAANQPGTEADKLEAGSDTDKPTAEAPAGDSPSPFDAADDSKAAMPEELPEPANATGLAEELGPRNAPQLMLADVSAAMDALKTANKAYVSTQQSADEAAIKKARAQFYVSLFSLAEAFTFAKDDPANPQLDAMRTTMQRILLQFFGDEKRVDALGANAALWLGYAKRNVAGIVLVGTVQELQQVGKLYHIKLELTSGKPTTVTVVTPNEPRLKANERALVLGSIVEHPAQQIAGYEGDEAAVVWTGMAVPIPAAP